MRGPQQRRKELPVRNSETKQGETVYVRVTPRIQTENSARRGGKTYRVIKGKHKPYTGVGSGEPENSPVFTNKECRQHICRNQEETTVEWAGAVKVLSAKAFLLTLRGNRKKTTAASPEKTDAKSRSKPGTASRPKKIQSTGGQAAPGLCYQTVVDLRGGLDGIT